MPKNLYNLVSLLFTVNIIVTFVIWVWDNLPRQGGVKWLLSLEDMFVGEHDVEVPSYHFNADEKLRFWDGFVVFELVLSASGWTLDRIVPDVDYYRSTVQLAKIIRTVAAVGVVNMSLDHVYMGAIGMESAYHAIRNGYVDEVWTKEHHEFQYDDVKAGKIPTQRPQPPAPLAPSEQSVKS